jgi:hypothetical protein
MTITYAGCSDDELIAAYSTWLEEMQKRGIIKGKNVVGDLGERIALNHYNTTPGLTTLGKAPDGAKDFDAVGKNGMRYSIKATSGQVTGAFFGLPAPTSQEVVPPRFDFVIIVKFDHAYRVQTIAEITWEQFCALKKWLPRQNAYNLNVSGKFLAMAKILFPKAQPMVSLGLGKVAQPGAPPNGGPATQVGKSGVSQGPPLVS